MCAAGSAHKVDAGIAYSRFSKLLTKAHALKPKPKRRNFRVRYNASHVDDARAREKKTNPFSSSFVFLPFSCFMHCCFILSFGISVFFLVSSKGAAHNWPACNFQRGGEKKTMPAKQLALCRRLRARTKQT